MFVKSVRTSAVWTQAIERWNSERRRERPIASTTGFAVSQLNPNFGGQNLGPFEQGDDPGCSLQRRSIDSARNLQTGAANLRFQAVHQGVQPLALSYRTDSNVDVHLRLIGHHVGA